MEIVNEWLDDPERPIFLVDETRRALARQGDELIVFNCVVVGAKEARTFLRRTVAIRRRIGAQSFKGRDLGRPEMAPSAGQLRPLVGQSLLDRRGFYRAVTTASALKALSRSVKARISAIADGPPDLPATIEGRELPVLLTLIKAAANSLEVGARRVDVIVDRSDQFGLGPMKRRLPPAALEVLGPGQFNRGPNGQPAQMVCHAEFRIVADSDEGPFRDLLLLPDYAGYYALKNPPPEALIERLQKESIVFSSWDPQPETD